MKYRLLSAASLLAGLVTLAGCVETVLVGGGATGAAVATDRRTAGSILDDEVIEHKTGSVISDDASLKDVHINATSMNGIVLLTGEAPTEAQRTRILEHARKVPRVRQVVNEIRVAPPTSYGSRSNDAWLTTKVRSKMSGEKQLDSYNIKVVTENGVVYLMGLAKKAEGDKAAELARAVGGVQRVVKLFEYTD